MLLKTRHIILLILVFSFAKKSYPQQYQEGKFGVNIGIVFAIGTLINRFGGNISKTASFVGMERSALHRKLKSLNIVTNLKTGNRVAVVLENDSTNDYIS